MGAGDEDVSQSRIGAAWRRGSAVAWGGGLPVTSGTLSVGRWASGGDSLGVRASAAPTSSIWCWRDRGPHPSWVGLS